MFLGRYMEKKNPRPLITQDKFFHAELPYVIHVTSYPNHIACLSHPQDHNSWHFSVFYLAKHVGIFSVLNIFVSLTDIKNASEIIKCLDLRAYVNDVVWCHPVYVNRSWYFSQTKLMHERDRQIKERERDRQTDGLSGIETEKCIFTKIIYLQKDY